MIGGLTSGLSTALRTATAARATMDDMTRQIATGKRVASVKDDGAAWARAAGMRSEVATTEARRVALARAEAAMGVSKAAVERVKSVGEQMRDVLLSARDHAPGSAARQHLQADWSALVASLSTMNELNVVWPDNTGAAGTSSSGPGHLVLPNDDVFGQERLGIWAHASAFAGWFTVADAARPVALTTFDLANATAAQLDQATTSLNVIALQPPSGSLSITDSWLVAIGADERVAERWRDHLDATEDRLQTQIGALVDADLGAASSARAQAETRQALAMQTVRQALDAYQAKATGLLANVQRTQRSVLA